MTRTTMTAAIALLGWTLAACGQLVAGIDEDAPPVDPDAGETDRPGRADAGDTSCVEAAGVAPLADPLVANMYVARPAVAIGADQRPLVAWSASNQADRPLFVSAWDGMAWAPLGEMINPGAASQYGPAIVSDGDRVVVAWIEDPAGPAFLAPFAARWDGSTWTTFGGAVGGGPGVVIDVALAVDVGGAPIVAWSNYENDGQHGNMSVRVARWNGTAWTPLGAALDLAPDDDLIGVDPSLIIGADGAIILVWQEPAGSGVSSIRVRAFSGGQWVSYGGGTLEALGGATSVTSSRAVADSQGRLVIAWTEGTGAFVARWNGGVWDRLGSDLGAVAGDTTALVRGLAVDRGDRPIVSWIEPSPATSGALSTYVYHHTGNGFVPLATGLFDAAPGTTSSYGAAIATDDCDRIFVAWNESTSPSSAGVYVRRAVRAPAVP